MLQLWLWLIGIGVAGLFVMGLIEGLPRRGRAQTRKCRVGVKILALFSAKNAARRGFSFHTCIAGFGDG